MRILLSGGAGFIGSHVAERLLERGHEVAVADDLSSGKRENIPVGARFYETDIRTGCTGVFEEFSPEALCHQAAQMDVRRSVREPDFDAEVNILGTVRLLQNCVKYAQMAYFSYRDVPRGASSEARAVPRSATARP
jgi:UDP-glucose 4-epimerase